MSSGALLDAVQVIRTKRDGGELTDDQIDWVIAAYTAGEVAEEQMSALAMAILFRGLNRRELSRWTQAMIGSGDRMDFSGLSRPTADKHSTGGVGDMITLPARPAGRRVRGGGAPAVRSRARAYRRHPGQARGHPRLAGRARARRRCWPSWSRWAR